MSNTKGNKDKSNRESPPTASFDSSVLGPGSQIGQFRIERELGRGAVGIVYLAHDTKLDREVAIKSLPEDVTSNPLVRARFQREARLLAGLNHPNIATIYDELQEVEDTSYLVLEYIAGDTLAERIEKGPLPIEEALNIGQQIAEAVAAAHEQGVIHRDLKPGNIKITPDGKVKVLDFGLAKAVGGEGADQQSTITVPGRVIGTPAYMSPEQARGNPTDHRSDIWSFGCVLFEMLTGRIPFKGETVSDTLVNILQSSPEWEKLPETTPSNIKVMIRRCLEKDQQKRLRDMGDAALEISETIHLPKIAPPVVSAGGGITGPVSKRQLVVVGLLCGIISIIAGLFLSGVIFKKSTNENKVTRSLSLHISDDTPLAVETAESAMALSPNGEYLVYVGRTKEGKRLYLRDLKQYEVEPLEDTEDASNPFFSSDSKWVGYFSQGELKKVSIVDGTIRTIPINVRGYSASWHKNKIVFSGDNGLYQVSDSGGIATPITELKPTEGELEHSWPQIINDGKAVLFTVGSYSPSIESRIGIYSFDTKVYNIIREGDFARYIPSGRIGHVIYAIGQELHAAPFDLSKLDFTDAPAQPILKDAMMNFPFGIAYYTFSDNGSLVYASGQSQSNLIWFDHKGKSWPVIEEKGGYRWPRISPDRERERVAMTIIEEDQYHIYIYDIDRIDLTRFTTEGHNDLPIWKPPGGSITFNSTRTGTKPGNWNIFEKTIERSSSGSSIDQLTTADYFHLPGSWFPKGDVLAYESFDPDNKGDIYLYFEDTEKSEPFIQTPYAEYEPRFSPDGKWIAYVSKYEADQPDVYVTPYPGPGDQIKVSTGGGHDPIWDPNGTRLFYRNLKNTNLMVVDLSDIDLESKPPLPRIHIEDGPFLGNVYDYRSYDITPDGEKFIAVELPSGPTELKHKSNWFEELNRLVPTGKN